MKRLIEFFIRNHLFGDILTLSVILIGVGSIVKIRRETFPNINFDIISIVTAYPGASPEEVEKLVTNPIEQDLKEVDGVKKVFSSSIENRSGIVVYLDPDQTTEEKGKQDIQDVIDRSTELPDAVEDPLVTAMQSKLNPIIEVSLAGDLSAMELRKAAKFLEEEIETVKGVARVVHRGLRDIEIRVEPDVRKMAQYRVSLDEVVAALAKQNLAIPGGTIESDPRDINSPERLVRTVGDFKDLEDVQKTVIRANDAGSALTVGQIAKVYYDLAKAQILNRTNGKSSLSLTVLKKEKADAIDVVDLLKKKIEQVSPQLPAGAEVKYVNDMSQYIRRRLSVLTSNMLVGLILVMALLPLIMPFRFSLIISMGVPFAFLGTMMLLYYSGQSINLISMIGLIIVSGILVDDAIVVTENSARLIDEGVPPIEAATQGTQQILASVAASVATTAIVFLPMAFMSGIFGKFIVQIPVAVVTALCVSLFEATLILPAHVAHWIRPTREAETASHRLRFFSRIFQWTRTVWDIRLVPVYLRILDVCLKRRYWVATSFFLLFVGSLVLAKVGMRFVLFPPEGIEIFFVRTEAPTGTSLEKHQEMLLPIEEHIRQLPQTEVENYVTSVGLVQQDPNDPSTRRGPEFAQIIVFLTPESDRKRKALEIIDALRASVGERPEFTRITFNRVNPGPPQGKPISLGVRGKDYPSIMKAADHIKTILAGMTGVTDISDDYRLGREEWQVKIDGPIAAATGLSVQSIGTAVRAAFEGIEATSIRTLDEEIKVRVSLPQEQRAQSESLEGIMIPNPFGNLTPLKSVAKVEKSQGVLAFNHEGYDRQVKVSAEVDVTKTSSIEANGILRKMLPELNAKFPGIKIDFGGEDEDTQESMASLGRAFILAVIGIFLILVLTFKNLIQPILVMLTVPLGVISVILAFFVHNMPISFMGMLGIIALAGVIVNNAIVFVDFVNQARGEGSAKMESIREAAKKRIRPIFLTTATTVFGLLPTAYGIGGLDKFVVPIALALAWGLMFGSILTSLIFPASLAILDDITGLIDRKILRRKKA